MASASPSPTSSSTWKTLGPASDQPAACGLSGLFCGKKYGVTTINVTKVPGLGDYEALASSERQIGGALFEFLRNEIGVRSFDELAALQVVPEFLVHVQDYPAHGTSLVPSSVYPTFQAIESAIGFCHHGCISCVLNPEQNIHGMLSARHTANKLLLDAFYRTAVCEQGTSRTDACYPGSGPARTVPWPKVVSLAASAAGTAHEGAGPINVELSGHKGPDVVTVVPSTLLGGWAVVFRTGWDPAPAPQPNLRVRMGDVYPLG